MARTPLALPDFPWDSLAPFAARAKSHPDGFVDLSVGSPVDATPAQVSLAWLLALGDDWSPIPGTIRIDHLEEDLGALDVVLSPEHVQRLSNLTPARGDHHTAPQLALFDR